MDDRTVRMDRQEKHLSRVRLSRTIFVKDKNDCILKATITLEHVYLNSTDQMGSFVDYMIKEME